MAEDAYLIGRVAAVTAHDHRARQAHALDLYHRGAGRVTLQKIDPGQSILEDALGLLGVELAHQIKELRVFILNGRRL